MELSQEEGHLRDLECSLRQDAVEHARCTQHTLLMSLPGIGPWLAAVILGETGGDILRFHSGDALIAAAGLDPRVRQSGATLQSRGRLTKRGSPHLRWALFCAAVTAARCDPDLHAYYERKRSEGKKYTVTICAVSRKLALRLYAVVQRGSPYVKTKDL
jgi:transposase